jgi:16S rRNA (cytidine1402-2'-O)-methyltransferase
VGATLDDLVSACGGERPAAVCRELTKLHEEIRRASLSGLAEAIHSGAIPARGEFAIVVGAVPEPRRTPDGAGDRSAGTTGPGRPEPGAELATARAEVDALAAGGLARGDAARRVAARTGLPRRQLYGGGAER